MCVGGICTQAGVHNTRSVYYNAHSHNENIYIIGVVSGLTIVNATHFVVLCYT